MKEIRLVWSTVYWSGKKSKRPYLCPKNAFTQKINFTLQDDLNLEFFWSFLGTVLKKASAEWFIQIAIDCVQISKSNRSVELFSLTFNFSILGILDSTTCVCTCTCAHWHTHMHMHTGTGTISHHSSQFSTISHHSPLFLTIPHHFPPFLTILHQFQPFLAIPQYFLPLSTTWCHYWLKVSYFGFN